MASTFSLRSLFRPLLTPSATATSTPTILQSLRAFSTTPTLAAGKKPKVSKAEAAKSFKQNKVQAAVRAAARRKRQAALAKLNPKVAGLMKFLYASAQIPPPLRMARQRYLRHMTIHRAWQLFQRKRTEARERELMRMQQGMSEACEVLRNLGGPGTRPVGWLYRVAMMKVGLWQPTAIPIEYARPVVETPGERIWNHEWKRPLVKGTS